MTVYKVCLNTYGNFVHIVEIQMCVRNLKECSVGGKSVEGDCSECYKAV